MLPQGLFGRMLAGREVICASVFHPGRLVRRPLTTRERLRLYQLPLSFDETLTGYKVGMALPCEDAPPPGLFAAMFCQLWGVRGVLQGS